MKIIEARKKRPPIGKVFAYVNGIPVVLNYNGRQFLNGRRPVRYTEIKWLEF